MKIFGLITIGSLLLTSCYTYQAYNPEAIASADNKKENVRMVSPVRLSREQTQQVQQLQQGQNVNDIIEVNPKNIIKPKEFFQVKVLGNETKIEAVKWEGDTLVAHVKGQPKKILKFHEKDIEDFKVRKFSKGRSDALTIAAYATAGVGVFLLLK